MTGPKIITAWEAEVLAYHTRVCPAAARKRLRKFDTIGSRAFSAAA